MFTKLMIWAAFGNSGLCSLYFEKLNANINAEMYRVIKKEGGKVNGYNTNKKLILEAK